MAAQAADSPTAEQRRRFAPKGLLLRFAGAFVTANLLLLYIPISAISLAAIAVIGAMIMLLDHRNGLILTASLVTMTLVLEVIVRAGGTDGTLSPYFRPHEILALESTYRANQVLEMDVPHGDLLAIDQSLPRSLAEKRHERVMTDSFGYRNENDYHGEPLIVIGDSFTVGSETYLVSRLRQQHQVHAYNVSFSATGPMNYAEKVQWSRRHLAPNACIVLFFFEGNDFQPHNAIELETRRHVPGAIQGAVKQYVRAVRGVSEWSKVFYGLLTRTWERWRQHTWQRTTGKDTQPGVLSASEKTFVKHVGGKPMIFLRGYADVARRQSFDDRGFIRSQLSRATPDVLVFIPEKYRVYGPLTDEHPDAHLPTMQLDYLQSIAAGLKIPVIDLSGPLVERSRELLRQGEMTWWRDDTHWNTNGEAVAAEVLLRELSTSGNQSCVQAIAH
jgi:hypothetical protein